MQTLSRRSSILPKKRHRQRVPVLILLLAIASIGSGAVIAAQAQQAPDPTETQAAFGPLTEAVGLVEGGIRTDGAGTYALVGGSTRFVFAPQDAHSATIRFLCDDCAPAQRVLAAPTGRGDTVYKSEDGQAVLRLTAVGGATLFGGAAFVPADVPEAGQAVIRAR